jgi:hypothetical protein
MKDKVLLPRSNALTIVGGKAEGYVEYNGTPLGWKGHYQLYPVPKDQLILNASLLQNAGW